MAADRSNRFPVTCASVVQFDWLTNRTEQPCITTSGIPILKGVQLQLNGLKRLAKLFVVCNQCQSSLYGLLSSLWCFSILVKYYFQVSFILKIILSMLKIPWLSPFNRIVTVRFTKLLTISEVRLKFPEFATNLAISLSSCQSNRKLRINEVVNFHVEFRWEVAKLVA